MNPKIVSTNIAIRGVVMLFISTACSYAQVEVKTRHSADNPYSFYGKIENNFEVIAPDLDPSKIKVECDHGVLSGSGFYYNILPGDYNDVTVKVTYDGVPVAKQKFMVMKVPDPSVCYANQCGPNMAVQLHQLDHPVVLRVDGLDLPKFPEIVSFTVKMNSKKFQVTSRFLPDDVKNMIKDSGVGTTIEFTDIVCQMPFDEIRKLKSVKLVVH